MRIWFQAPKLYELLPVQIRGSRCDEEQKFCFCDGSCSLNRRGKMITSSINLCWRYSYSIFNTAEYSNFLNDAIRRRTYRNNDTKYQNGACLRLFKHVWSVSSEYSNRIYLGLLRIHWTYSECLYLNAGNCRPLVLVEDSLTSFYTLMLSLWRYRSESISKS